MKFNWKLLIIALAGTFVDILPQIVTATETSQQPSVKKALARARAIQANRTRVTSRKSSSVKN